jgi:16S rRNA (guanine527-N7)-methyltransferase
VIQQPSESRTQLLTEQDARDYVASLADGLAMERLERFAGLLIEENRRQNLIARATEGSLWLRHFADSAQLLRHVPRETMASGEPWLDLGTGAGFPGIVIAILRPDWPIRLVESRARRVEFLERARDLIALPECSILGQRMETIAPFPSAVLSARAFAPLDKLLRLSAPFSTKRTVYLLPKGRSAAHELSGQRKAIRAMFHVEHSLTDPSAGIIVSHTGS